MENDSMKSNWSTEYKPSLFERREMLALNLLRRIGLQTIYIDRRDGYHEIGTKSRWIASPISLPEVDHRHCHPKVNKSYCEMSVNKEKVAENWPAKFSLFATTTFRKMLFIDF